MGVGCDYLYPVWASTFKASLGNLHSAMAEECRWKGGMGNQIKPRCQTPPAQAVCYGQTQRNGLQWGFPGTRRKQAHCCLPTRNGCPWVWPLLECLLRQLGPNSVFCLLSFSEVISGHRCASPTAIQERRWISFPKRRALEQSVS